MPHTPGNWQVAPLSKDTNVILSLTPEEKIIATVWPPNSEANARLIAAAPDLLAACEQALKALAAFDGYTGEGADACISLRKAIAKSSS